MGWPGNMISYVSNAVQQTLSNPLNPIENFKNDMKSLDSQMSEAGLGSGRYLWAPSYFADYERGQENKKVDEQKAKEAEAKYQESLNNIGNIATYQEALAENFDKNKDKYTGLLQDVSKRDIRGQLTDTLTKTKDNFNVRGLLGSGIKKFSDESNNAKALADIQNADYENAQTIANQARDFKNQAASTRTAAQGGATAKAISDYQTELAAAQAKNSTYGALGQAGGMAAGNYLAKQKAAK